MREMVLLVQATLQWHSMGEKQSSFLMLGDIFSPRGQLRRSATEEPDALLLEPRCLLLPRRPPPAPPPLPPAPPPPPPPPPPPLLLLLPARTIHPHSIQPHSIGPARLLPSSSEPASFLTAVRHGGGVYSEAPWEPCYFF
ncbi:hypothetical protein AOLI_G00213280 [Acnodon oligacanthus]